MKTPPSTLRAAAGFAVATLFAQALAGCSGTSPSLPAASAPAAAGPSAPTNSALTFSRPFHLHHVRVGASRSRKSWIRPEAKTASELFYVSDAFEDVVHIYSWPSLTQLGTITGIGEPVGLCVDKSGDVYVADYADSQVDEYQHGSVVRIATLTADYAPVGCSVDMKTGSLAVGTYGSDSGSPIGGVLIYAHGRGTPTSYTAANLDQVYFPAYDNSGNLFADGYAGSAPGLAELPNGGSKFEQITINQTIVEPSGLQYDGQYLAIGDAYDNTIYQLTVSGTNATKVGSTSLTDAAFFQFWVTATTKGQGNQVAATGDGSADVWNYPAGGNPTNSVTGFDYPVGVTISQK
jgi:hypothetical protein